MMFSVPYLREIIDISGVILLFISVWLFYKLDVTALSRLANVQVQVNWRTLILNYTSELFPHPDRLAVFKLTVCADDPIFLSKTCVVKGCEAFV